VDRGLIGIVSGLGPRAGSDVLDKLYQHAARRYHAIEDVDYPDVLLYSHGIEAFDMTGSIDARFGQELITAVEVLEAQHPTVIGIACITAHLFLDELRSHTKAEVIDLITEVARAAAQLDRRYLVLSSSTTRRTGLFNARLDRWHIDHVEIDDAQQLVIDEIVHLVMGGQLEFAGATIRDFVRRLEMPFDAVIAGCTELPMAFDHSGLGPRPPVIDSNRVLAQALADRCYARTALAPPRRRLAVAS
jgi:aspartate racemase